MGALSKVKPNVTDAQAAASPVDGPRLPATRIAAAWVIPLTTVIGLIAWEGLARWSGWPAFILPRPLAVWQRFITVMADGLLLWHAGITAGEVLAGLAIGL